MRRVAGQAMEIGKRNAALAGAAGCQHARLERGERDAHVGGMRGDAVLARAPRIACMRLIPSIAEQPLPGSRLLHGVVVS